MAGDLDAPPVFEQLLADILKNEGAKAHVDLAHGFAAFFLVLLADGVEMGAAVMLTGQWMRSLLEHGAQPKEAD